MTGHDWVWWVGQTLGFVASAVFLYSSATVSRRRTILANNAGNVVAGTSTVLLGLWGASATNFVSLIRGLVAERTRDHDLRFRNILTVSFVALTWVAFTVGNGWPDRFTDFVPYAASATVCVALALHGVTAVKMALLTGSALWSVYMVAVGMWGAFAGEAVYVVAGVVAVARIRRISTGTAPGEMSFA